MNNNSKIYVAGHTGLVGSAIVRKLQAMGYTKLILKTHSELDLRRQDAVEKFFEREKPEYVFLAAAKVGGILANNTYKAEFIYDNLAIALSVVKASYETNVKKLINLGSSCIYPKFAPQPMKEEHLLTGLLEQTNEPYAIAKIAAIKLCRYFNEQYGANFISVMPTNLYGPNDNFNLETAHVLPSLIRKFYLAKLLSEQRYDLLFRDVQRYPLGFGFDQGLCNGKITQILTALEKLGITANTVILWGSGSPYREFLHVDDLADAVVYLMKNFQYRDIGELINIGTGNDMTITDIALQIKKIIGFEGEIQYDPSKPDGTPRKLLDVSKIERLKWRAKISLVEGVKQTASWYMESI